MVPVLVVSGSPDAGCLCSLSRVQQADENNISDAGAGLGLKVADQRGTNAGVTGSILPNALFTPRLLKESLGLGNAQAVANVPPGNL
jgi:hypothetical protein